MKTTLILFFEFTNSEFIIAFTFSVNIHKNRISFFVRSKQLQGFVLERGDMRKLVCLVQEKKLYKFSTWIFFEKTSLRLRVPEYFLKDSDRFFSLSKFLLFFSTFTKVRRMRLQR